MIVPKQKNDLLQTLGLIKKPKEKILSRKRILIISGGFWPCWKKHSGLRESHSALSSMSRWLSSLHNPLATALAQIKQVLKTDLGLWCKMSHEGSCYIANIVLLNETYSRVHNQQE
jgi:hypothetical protein